MNNNDCGRDRILHVFRAPLGGVFRHVCDLAMGQSERGNLVGVVCDSTLTEALSEERLAHLRPCLALGLHRIPMTREVGMSDWRAARSLNVVLRKVRPTIVHGHGAKGGAYTRLLGGRARKFYTPHGGTLLYPRRSLAMTVEKLLEARTTGLIFESRYAADRYALEAGEPGCAMRVIYNGLRREEFRKVTASAQAADFLFLGELRRRKGADLFIDALAEIAAKVPVSACIVGSGKLERHIKAIADERLHGAVRFFAPMRAREAFTLARCVVMPSRDESMPYVALEALGAEKPLITTRVGGIPEIFGEHADLLLAPNDAAGLSNAMWAFLHSPTELQKRVSRLAGDVRETFSLERMVDSVLEFYAAADGTFRAGQRPRLS